MVLHLTAQRRGKLVSFLRRELGLSSSLVKRLKWRGAFLVNGETAHTDRMVEAGEEITVVLSEHAAETAELEALWVKMGNCVGKTKELQPMGVYVPSEKNVAVFHIEGLSDAERDEIPQIRAPYDTDVYCVVCNKTQHVKAGEVIPFCCGRLMEILD